MKQEFTDKCHDSFEKNTHAPPFLNLKLKFIVYKKECYKKPLQNNDFDQYGAMVSIANDAEMLQECLTTVRSIVVIYMDSNINSCTQTVKLIRSDIRVRHVPIIVIADLQKQESINSLVKSGIDYYINEPVSRGFLNCLLVTIIKNRQALIENVRANGELFYAKPELNEKSLLFLETLTAYVQSNIDNPELKYDLLSTKLGMCKTCLYQKIKELTGKSPGEFIKMKRVEHAEKLMLHKGYSVSEAAYHSGFNCLSGLTRAFKKLYNTTPKKYMQESNSA